MRTLLRSATVLLTLAWPVLASAVAPSSVTGVKAVLKGGAIEVSWQAAAPAENVVKYRVYYSRKSILQNGGMFDDYDTTAGATTTHTLTDFPSTGTLYIGVLAVNAQNQESTVFAEEATVTLAGGKASSSATAVPDAMTPPTATDALRLVSAVPVSDTTVLLSFSQALSSKTPAKNDVIIEDPRGSALAVQKVEAQGSTVMVTTAEQTPDTRYRIRVLGFTSANNASLDPLASATTFTSADSESSSTGDAANIPSLGAAVSSASSSSAPAVVTNPPLTGSVTQPMPMAGDVTNARAQATSDNRGMYTVVVEWEAPAGAQSFDIQQSRDRGVTYSNTQTVPGTARSVRFSGVAPGTFSVLIRARGADNAMTRGTVASVILPFTSPRVPTSSPLTSTGPAAVLAILGTGSIAGWWEVRRRAKAALKI